MQGFYISNLSARILQPDGGLVLPRMDENKAALFVPKYKAVILYFMYFAADASGKTDSEKESNALRSCGQFYASEFLKREYDVDSHPDSIREYYNKAKTNAKKVGDWDPHALAEIVSSQLRSENSLREVLSFVAKLDDKGVYRTPGQRFFLKTLRKLDQSPSHIKFASYCWGALRKNVFKIPDPSIDPPHKKELETALEYEHVCGFEEHMKKKSYTPND